MSDPATPADPTEKRRYIGMQFDCCKIYVRVYFNERLKAYAGNCPKCLRQVKVEVDPSRATTSSRFFKAT